MTIINTETGEVWVPDGAVKMEERTGTEQLKLAIVGPPKGGKSRLASTAPRKPIYFFDFDNRLASLAGREGVFGKTYVDTTTPNKSTAWNQVEIDMGMFEYQKLSGKPVPGTMVFDSMTYMIERAMRRVLVENATNPKVTRAMSLDGRTYLNSNGWEGYSQELNLIGNMLARGVELGCDVIAIFHERAEEEAGSTSEKRKFTGKISVHPPRTEALLPLFDEYYRILPNWDGSEYEVYTGAGADFNGGTSLLIDKIEKADLTQMFNKHLERLRELKNKQKEN